MWCFKKREEIDLLPLVQGTDVPAFTFKTLSRATKWFSKNKKLGQGGFGQVYKGVLPRGEEVAIKRLFHDSSQGLQQLENEIRILHKLQHQNVVRLLGYCIERKEKLLVYEYLSGKSLDVILFDEVRSTELTWGKRRELILGIAQGILYIHQDAPLRVVHLDLKPENILLDSQIIPKISDFGFSQILEENQTQGRIKKVAGTTGYQAPEYAVLHRFSPASDVYSYGVVMLEISCGRKCTSYHDPEGDIFYVTDYAWSVWEKGNVTDLLDKTVAATCNANEAKKYIKLALLCAQNLPDVRPSMSWIVSFLCNENNTHESLPAPQKTVYYGSNE